MVINFRKIFQTIILVCFFSLMAYIVAGYYPFEYRFFIFIVVFVVVVITSTILCPILEKAYPDFEHRIFLREKFVKETIKDYPIYSYKPLFRKRRFCVKTKDSSGHEKVWLDDIEREEDCHKLMVGFLLISIRALK